MGGADVLRHMRKNGVHIPVIVISGLRREAIDANLDELGAAFLNKDEMNPRDFHDAIETSLKLMGVSAPTRS